MTVRTLRPFAGLLLTAAMLPALTPSAQAATPNDTLVYALSLAQVISLDPHQNGDATSVAVMVNLYDRLLASTPDGQLLPQLALSWDVTPEALTFHLNPEARFASGRAVTAEDVVWSFTRLMKLDMAVSGAFKPAGYSADNIEDLVHAVDEHTVRLDVPGDMAGDLLLFRLAEVSASVVDREIVMEHESNGDWGNDWLRVNSAGSGPFALNRWSPNEMVILQAEPDYWGGAPELNRIVLRHVPESQVQRLMLERGDIDIAASLSATDIGHFSNYEGVEIQRVPTGGFYVLAMNAQHPQLADPQVREAIYRAIDFEGIQNTIVGPYGEARHVPVPTMFEGAISDPEAWSYDPDTAREMLAEAGYGDGFSITIKTIAETPRVDLATAIQAALTEIGIDASVVQGAGADIVSMHRARDFDLLIPQTGAYMQNVLGSMEQFASNPDNSEEANNAGNFVWRSAWDIPELTELTAEAMREPDAERRFELFTQMQEMFVEASPAVFPMYERFNPIAISERVEGFVGHPQNAVRLEDVTKSN